MKILFYRYGNICEPDIIDGFEELAHTVSQITEQINNKNMEFGAYAKIVGQYLLDHPHDCVFTVNFFPLISDVCNIFKIPYICWSVDSPVLEFFAKSVQNSCNRIFYLIMPSMKKSHRLTLDTYFTFLLLQMLKVSNKP